MNALNSSVVNTSNNSIKHTVFDASAKSTCPLGVTSTLYVHTLWCSPTELDGGMHFCSFSECIYKASVLCNNRKVLYGQRVLTYWPLLQGKKVRLYHRVWTFARSSRCNLTMFQKLFDVFDVKFHYCEFVTFFGH